MAAARGGPPNDAGAARAIVERLRGAGHSAYFAGGCVRDLLLGSAPQDYDVATSARPETVALLFPDSVAVGAHFGVLLVDGVEVATYRTDHDYRDGRHPSRVEYSTDPKEDVLRRDFTINALLMDPFSGEVLDFTGGRADLERRLVRTVGEPVSRFSEDYLRMLRAVRFAARLDFTLDSAAAAAIRGLAPRIHEIAAERVRDEITLILTEGRARFGFELLDETGLLAEILPEAAAMKGVAQPPEFHPEGDVWIHTRMMLEQLDRPAITLALGVLLHDVGKPPTFRVAERIRFDGHVELGARMAVAILSRLRYSNEQIARVESLVANHLRFKDVRRMKESTLKRFLRIDGFDEQLELHRLDCLCSHGNLDSWEFVRDRLAHTPPEALRPEPLLTGHDLIAAGFAPGPAFREILEAVETAQLEGRLASRQEAMEFVRARFAPASLG